MLTPQYTEFPKILSKYRDQGLNFAGFPCNQFDLEEPGKNSEILNGIKYVRPGNGYEPDQNMHIYGKLKVNGEDAHPMYKFLKSACGATGTRIGGPTHIYADVLYTYDIVWNFEKFLVDRDGRPQYRFHPGAWQNGTFVEKFILELLGQSNSSSPSSSSSNIVQTQIPQNPVLSTISIQTPSQNSEPSSNTPQPPVPVQNPGNITLNDLMSGSSAVSNNENGGSSANRGWMQWRQPAQN